MTGAEDLEAQFGPPSVQVQIAELLRGFTEALDPIAEAMTGYRRSLVEQGWSEPTAEQIAGVLLASWNQRVMSVIDKAAAAAETTAVPS